MGGYETSEAVFDVKYSYFLKFLIFVFVEFFVNKHLFSSFVKMISRRVRDGCGFDSHTGP